MTRIFALAFAATQMGFCSSNSNDSSQNDPFAFSCSDYQIMVDVEVEILQECSTDAQCEQVLENNSCDGGAISSNPNIDPSYFFELVDEAEAAGCNVEIVAECGDSDSTPTCHYGTCGWN